MTPHISAGTDNEELLSDPIYVGVKHRRLVLGAWQRAGTWEPRESHAAGRAVCAGSIPPFPLQHTRICTLAANVNFTSHYIKKMPVFFFCRITGDAYDELLDEFFTAVRRRFGTSGACAAACGSHFCSCSHSSPPKVLARWQTRHHAGSSPAVPWPPRFLPRAGVPVVAACATSRWGPALARSDGGLRGHELRHAEQAHQSLQRFIPHVQVCGGGGTPQGAS